MRLDKYIAKATGLTRSQAKREIRLGSVLVNGEPAKAEKNLTDDDDVSFQGQSLHKPGLRYFMLNKPAGVVCANHDRLYDVAIDIFWQEPHYQQLSCVGRLDIDTTGLLLVTDDGKWAHKITSPNHHCVKIYQAELDADIDEKMIKQFSEGFLLEGEKNRTRPATLKTIGPNMAQVEITEGRYHQVKRMFHACGLEVLALHRSQVGQIALDESLQPGEYRELTEKEIQQA